MMFLPKLFIRPLDTMEDVQKFKPRWDKKNPASDAGFS